MVAINSHRRDFSVDPSPSDTATCRYIATVKALTKMKDQEEMKRGVHITGIITREETHYHSKCVHRVTTLVNEKLWDMIALFWISVIAKWAEWGWQF